MAGKRPRDERPAVGRLARFNVAATLVITVVATIVVIIGGFVAYSLVLVTAERNIATRLETLTRSMLALDRRTWDAEWRALNQLATAGQTDFPGFVLSYRPGQPSGHIQPQTIRQLDSRLAAPIPDGEPFRIHSWTEQSTSKYERWLIYQDRHGLALAAKVDYLTPAAHRLLDRRVALVGELHGVSCSWFMRMPQATSALTRLLHDHGLPGKWDAATFTGVHRSVTGFHITVNETKVQGDAIALAVPTEISNLLLVALSDKTTLGEVIHYGRYVVASSVAILFLIWGAAVAWIRGTKRQARLALQQSNFVAAVSHELRTPLTAIRGAAEMLAHDMVPDGKKAGYYQSILGEADRLSRMVEQILDFDRMQRGKLDVAPQPTDLTAVVQRVAGMMQPVAAKRDVQLDLVPADPVVVAADPDTLAQALTNLIDNAIKFSPSGAEVRIALNRRAATAVLSVDDSGPGVPKAERGRIFEAFYRVGDEHTRKTKGSGLGLYLVHRYVTAVGGTIRVTDADGGGARFEVELPLV